MTYETLSDQKTSLSQVWAQLATEHQAGVIQLMAQLILKLIIEQLESGGKEGGDAHITGA
jgi:hypothetical protein